MKREIAVLRNNRKFLRYLFSRFISNLGNGMGPVALAFGILGLVGRTGTDLSLVLFAQGVPTIVLMLVGGVLGDRFSRSLLMGSADIALFFVIVVIGYLFLIDGATTARLIVLSVFIGCLHALWWPASSGMIQLIVEKERIQSATSLIMLSSNLGFIIGAGAGAFIVAHYGAAIAMFIDAATFLIAGAIVVSMKLPSVRQEGSARKKLSLDFQEGFLIAKSLKWFFVIVISFAFINMVWEATYSILGPLSLDSTYDTIKTAASRWSLIIASISIGMLVGSYIALKVRFKKPLQTTMLLLLFLATFVLILGIPGPLWLILITGMLSGIAVDIFNVIWLTILSTLIESEKLSRISSFDSFGSYVLYPIGIAIAGPLADQITPELTLLYGSGLMYLLIFISLLFPSVRNLKLIGAE